MPFSNKKPNYNQLLDNEIWQFIKKSESFLSEKDESKKSISEIRMCYNKLCKHFKSSYPKNVLSEDVLINSIRVRHYKKKVNSNSKADIIYFHGGGFTLGDLESHDDICADICSKTGLDLFSIDYRLAPEYSPKEALEDGKECSSWLSKKKNKPIILSGDSSGGWIAANVTHKMRHELNNVIGQLLIYPSLGSDTSQDSFITHSNAPLLSTNWIASNRKKYFDNNNLNLEYFSPLKDNNYNKLPPTIIFVAECDPLADDGKLYAKKLCSNNVKAFCFIEKGLVHSYLKARHSSKIAFKSFRNIINAFINIANKSWPYN